MRDLHVTLCYFGAMREHVVQRIVGVLDTAALPREDLRGDQAVAERVVALPDAFTTARLRALYAAIPARIHAAVPRAAAHRPYQPHITLLRLRARRQGPLVRRRTTLVVDRVALYRSRPSPGAGSRYSIVREWLLPAPHPNRKP